MSGHVHALEDLAVRPQLNGQRADYVIVADQLGQLEGETLEVTEAVVAIALRPWAYVDAGEELAELAVYPLKREPEVDVDVAERDQQVGFFLVHGLFVFEVGGIGGSGGESRSALSSRFTQQAVDGSSGFGDFTPA